MHGQRNAGREPEKSRKAKLLQARKEERRAAARKRTEQRERQEEVGRLQEKVDRATDMSTSDLTGRGGSAASVALAAVRAMNTDYPETNRMPGNYREQAEQHPETNRTDCTCHDKDESTWAATQIATDSAASADNRGFN